MIELIQPYNLPVWLFRDKTLNQTLDLTCELGIVEQNSLTPNSKICEALKPYKQVFLKTTTQYNHMEQKT